MFVCQVTSSPANLLRRNQIRKEDKESFFQQRQDYVAVHFKKPKISFSSFMLLMFRDFQI